MGFYNVVSPCVVGKLHYTRPTTAPIEVDDEVAAPLVESGCLEPYQPGASKGDGSLLEAALDGVEPDAEVTVAPTLGTETAESVTVTPEQVGRESARQFAKAVDEAVATESPRRPRGRRRSEG